MFCCCSVECGLNCLAGLCCSWYLPSLEGFIFMNCVFFRNNWTAGSPFKSNVCLCIILQFAANAVLLNECFLCCIWQEENTQNQSPPWLIYEFLLLLFIVITIFEGGELNESVFHSVLNIVRSESSNVNTYTRSYQKLQEMCLQFQVCKMKCKIECSGPSELFLLWNAYMQ